LYIWSLKVVEVSVSDFISSEKADVYLDVDAEGNVLGLEALSLEDLALAIEERGGKLEVPERLGVAAGE
jgi:hypothetical protein